MPVYEYTCAACGHVTEALRKMSEADAPIACESCGKPETRRSHSVFAAGRAEAAMTLPMGGCGRCGDPQGSCGFN